MRLLNSLFVLLLALPVFGQDSGRVIMQLREFKGLNTVSSDFTIQPNEARTAHEIDLSRNLGALTKRYGYDSVSTISGQDSILGIYPAYLRDGRQYMVVVTDSAGVGYGNVYVTPYGSVNFDSLTRISTYWGVQDKPSFAMYDDNLYSVNGDHRGLMWNGDTKRDFPTKQPGAPTIIPVNDSGPLNGEYRYLFSAAHSISGLTISWGGVITDPVRVQNGKVLMTNFPWWQADTTDSSPDSCYIFVYRTKANPGWADQRDSVFYLGFTIAANSAADLDTIVLIDSIADGDLGSGSPLVSTAYVGRDSLLASVHSRYGSPGLLLSTVAVYDSAGDTTSDGGIFYGIPTQKDTLGVAYVCTFIDTVTGIQSDTSRSLVIFNDSTKKANDSLMHAITVSVPPINASDSGLAINLYRALVYQVTHDTGAMYQLRIENPGTVYEKRYWKTVPWYERLMVDTVQISDFYLVAQLPSSDTAYTDSIRYDSLSRCRRFVRGSVPSVINNLFTYDDRMFGTYGSNLYFSSIDSAYSWWALGSVALNSSDGDEITVAFPTQGGIMALKNKSAFVVYQGSDNEWNRSEITSLPGCIAPKSYARGNGGHYYLSDYGVVRIADGQFLDRRYNTTLVSAKLSNFSKLPTATKRNAVGQYIPRSQQYLLTIGDTTYVYDERADGWTTWSLTLGTAGMYGVESQLAFVPGDTMYFVRPGDSTLQRYGASEADDSTEFTMFYQSAPFGVDQYFEQLNNVGFWYNSGLTDTLMLYQKDERNQLIFTTGVTFPLVSSARYYLRSMTPKPRLYQSLYFGVTVGNSGAVRIDGLDVTYTVGPQEIIK